MAGHAEWQARASARVHRRRNPGMPDAEGALRASTAANDRYDGELSGACRAGLAGAGLQHPLPPPEDPDDPYSLPHQHRRPAPVDRQHRRESRRRWRVVGQETRTIQTTRLAQGPPRYRCGNAGNPGYRDYWEPGWRCPMLPDLLAQIPGDQPLGIVTADGAYDTRTCHAAIAARGATAVIPPRKNGKPWKEPTAGAVVRNEALRSCRRLGRAI
jgi:hypothetical protein